MGGAIGRGDVAQKAAIGWRGGKIRAASCGRSKRGWLMQKAVRRCNKATACKHCGSTELYPGRGATCKPCFKVQLKRYRDEMKNDPAILSAKRKYQKAYREKHREYFREYDRQYKRAEQALPEPIIAIKPFSIAPCGAEYDPEVCPMRYNAGLLKECRECILFKGAQK
jgi:hypothetical protein